MVALTGAYVAVLPLASAAPPAAAQEQTGPAPPAPHAADDADPLAAALEAALDAHDAAAALALFAPDAQVKEHVAVLAAGPERVAAWVRECLLPDVRLVPGTRRLGTAAATWAVRDALGCYWRARPDALRPGWDVAPAEGTLTVAVAGGRIATLTVVYDPAWEQRRLAAQAAPIRTAQAQATARAARTPTAAPAGGAAWWEQPRDRWYVEPQAQGTRPAVGTQASAPPAPGTQDHGTPSVAPWLAALGAVLGGVALLALRPRPREAP